MSTYYGDADGDGYGDISVTIQDCNPPAGYVSLSGDCNDSNAQINPGAAELCDGVDSDCDGVLEVLNAYYLDADGDGYGDTSISTEDCNPPAGYVATSGDCNDDDAQINPGAVELCDGVDSNCDGSSEDLITYYRDTDGDGYGDGSVMAQGCSIPDGYVATSGDCNDLVAEINPAREELCDEVDNNCDGIIDEGCEILGPCDGSYIFVHSFTRDVFRASKRVNSDATLENGRNVLITGGQEVNLLAEFEVLLGAEFEADVRPCSTSSRQAYRDGEYLDADLQEVFDPMSTVHITIEDSSGKAYVEMDLTVLAIEKQKLFKNLPAGVYWMKVDNEQGSVINKVLVVND